MHQKHDLLKLRKQCLGSRMNKLKTQKFDYLGYLNNRSNLLEMASIRQDRPIRNRKNSRCVKSEVFRVSVI